MRRPFHDGAIGLQPVGRRPVISQPEAEDRRAKGAPHTSLGQRPRITANQVRALKARFIFISQALSQVIIHIILSFRQAFSSSLPEALVVVEPRGTSGYQILMPKITASAPVLLVSDVVASANYFRDSAGFQYKEFYGDPPDFCICQRDGHYLMLAQVDDPGQIVPFWKIREKMWNAYFWVDDADGLYEEMKTKGAKMDYGPCTQPYGVREFGIQDLDGHDIGFGQVLG